MTDLTVVKTSTSIRFLIATISAEVVTNMVAGRFYRFTTNVNCYIRQGAAGSTTAAAASSNILVPAGQSVLLAGSNGAALAVIEATTGGGAGTLCQVFTLQES